MNRDEIIESVRKNIEDITSKYQYSFDDPPGSTIRRINDEGAQLVRKLTEERKIIVDTFRITISDIDYIYLLPFVPFVYPETDDNRIREAVCDYMQIGYVRFNGLPEQPDLSRGIFHSGYTTQLTLWEEALPARYPDIRVKFEPEFDPENPPKKQEV